VSDERGGQADGVCVFAGSRWDPFFEDFSAQHKTVATGKLAFTDTGANFMDGKNVLSVVVEFDPARLLPGADLIAVVGETLTRGSVNLRVERIGRPVHDLLLDPRQFDQVNRDSGHPRIPDRRHQVSPVRQLPAPPQIPEQITPRPVHRRGIA